MKCTTLRLLKPQQPYRILRVRMDNRVAILHLKEAENKEEFMCFMFHVLIPKFLEAIWMNNGESAGLKLNFMGCKCRQSHSDYQDFGQTICTISRVRNGPSARDPDICTK